MNIVILGGGISGLSAAWFAQQKYPNAKMTLLEKTPLLGGWIQTSYEGGFLFEKGPRTFQTRRCPNLLDLIRQVGLEQELIYSDPSASRRYLWSKGKLRSVASFFPQLLFALLRDLFVAKGDGKDESIYAFSRRRLGAKIANTLIDALAIGIYAGDIRTLSIRSCFPILYKWEQESSSLAAGALTSFLLQKRRKGTARGLFTLRNGMRTLIDALSAKWKGEVILNAPVEKIFREGVVARGTFYRADLILSALPGSEIGRLTGISNDFEAADLSIVNLVYGSPILPKRGFGYLVPKRENENLLGMIWDSEVFPQQSLKGETRLTAMLRSGGYEVAEDAIKRHLRVHTPPLYCSISHLSRAVPQYQVGYADKLFYFKEEVKNKFPSLQLLGNYLEGASVESCISLAKRVLLN